jgi:archaetidylinositol phosphate synthase
MTVSEARRAGRELVLDLVFRPLSNVLVPIFARLGIPPVAVVLANAATGLVAAIVLARAEFIAAAVLLQVKTILDNADGQLARATGRISLAGRYLDTEADLFVNAAIFAALAHVTGQPLLAVVAFVALTIVLAVDFNISALYREAHGTAQPLPPETDGRAERALTRIYDVVFGPLDRGSRWLYVRSEIDRVTVTILANLGLSTQLAVLGVCLVFGAPEVYLWFALCCLPLVGALLRPRPVS